jgi:hypothetical protein
MATDISPHWRELVQKLLPGLVEGESLEFTSPVDFNYNCLSWALSINHHLLDEVCGGFWPWQHIPSDTADGWAEVCKYHGFILTEGVDVTFVPGYEKIAIFEDSDGDLHACRQAQNGRWKSKLGSNGPDIDHDGLTALEEAYGTVVKVLQKKREDWETPESA